MFATAASLTGPYRQPPQMLAEQDVDGHARAHTTAGPSAARIEARLARHGDRHAGRAGAAPLGVFQESCPGYPADRLG